MGYLFIVMLPDDLTTDDTIMMGKESRPGTMSPLLETESMGPRDELLIS